MSVKGWMEGKPFGHPLHPLLIHFPIALFILSLVFDWLPLGTRSVTGAFLSMAAGVLTALVAAIPGFVDYSDIRRDHPAKRTATLHMLLNLTAVLLYMVNLALRYEQAPPPPLARVLSVAAVALLGVSGYLGGSLVYNNGIAVGRHRRVTRMPAQTLRVDILDADGSASLGSADQLADGETLRAQVNGYVMTVARVDGRYFAFQEFCTHRFGPLSEGTFERGSVVCPWHRSCFDLQTGAVTQGPAKVPLKTFAVEIRAGQIRVSVPRERPR